MGALDTLTAASRAELAALVPEIGKRLDDRPRLYNDPFEVRQARLSRAVAQLLQLAAHFERAQLWQKAVHSQLLAADYSQSLAAMGDAVRWLDRAVRLAEEHPESLEDGKRLDLYEQRGAVRAQAGQNEGAVDDLRCAVDAQRDRADRTRLRDALVQLGMAYRRADAYPSYTAAGTRDSPRAKANLEAALDIASSAHLDWHMGPTLLGIDYVRACTGSYGEAWTGT